MKKRKQSFYLNDFSVLNPTIWANEAILRLSPNMVVSNLIARDFDSKVAKFGDKVNAFVPGNFTMTRKGALCDNVVIQDASGASIQVELNQWPQVAFMICDGEEDRSSLDLIETLLIPAVDALAQGIDRIVGAQVYQFIENRSGHLNGMDETTFKDYVLETRESMNRRNVPLPGRVMLLTPGTETEGLKLDTIMTADKIADNGTALQEALLGRKYGFTFAMTQTQPEISLGQTAVTAAVNNASGYPAGATVIDFDGSTGGTLEEGNWIRIDGDDTPLHIIDVTGASLTVEPSLKRAVLNNAVITSVKAGAVNEGYGYIGSTDNPRVIGHAKEILVDGFDNSPPQLGQMLTFGVQEHKYTIIRLRVIDLVNGEFAIELDRPLIDPISNDDLVSLAPAGKYNFALLRNAFTLVSRPLPSPRSGTGAVSRVIIDPVNKISLRVTISYDAEKQGHLVVVDTLMGVGMLSSELGEIMLG